MTHSKSLELTWTKVSTKKQKCDNCKRWKIHGDFGYQHGWWSFTNHRGKDGKIHNGEYCRSCSRIVFEGDK